MQKNTIFSCLLGSLLLLTFPPGVFAKATVLRLAIQNSETNLTSIEVLQPWVKQVEEATNGNVKIDIFYNETLAKGKESWQAVKSGLADIAWCALGYWPGLTPLTDVITLPGLPFTTGEEGSELFWKLYSRSPDIQKEFNNVKLLLVHTSDPYVLITTKKPVTTLEDLRDMKIRTFGSNMTMQVKKLGAVPVSIPMPDNYTSLQKGIIDGMASSWEAVNGFRFYEVVNFYTEVPLGASHFAIIMNKKVWEGLDKKSQEGIMSVSGLQGSKFWGKHFFDSSISASIESAAKIGKKIEILKLSEDEKKRWIEASKPTWDEWLKINKKKGHANAQHILDSVLQLQKPDQLLNPAS